MGKPVVVSKEEVELAPWVRHLTACLWKRMKQNWKKA